MPLSLLHIIIVSPCTDVPDGTRPEPTRSNITTLFAARDVIDRTDNQAKLL
ncbi:hypothetical protein LOAG_05191 [Loa loa]|uniref:Uncharacterized protein n=1 Tax=Loa loa TaxID=7209 RepID=A0A1S0U0E1_LOALO|nr:hypothetical protein LOAG_05191 [Loa loa]EFO23295.1 hypothetical protein LOAG_05191 [Loa loa]